MRFIFKTLNECLPDLWVCSPDSRSLCSSPPSDLPSCTWPCSWSTVRWGRPRRPAPSNTFQNLHFMVTEWWNAWKNLTDYHQSQQSILKNEQHNIYKNVCPSCNKFSWKIFIFSCLEAASWECSESPTKYPSISWLPSHRKILSRNRADLNIFPRFIRSWRFIYKASVI